MHLQLKERLAVLGALVLAAAAPARAQDWQDYAYPEAGFSAHFPGKPAVTDIRFKAGDIAAPAKAYAVQLGKANYSVVVADLSSSAIGQDAAIETAAKDLAAAGQVKLDVRARIDRQFGRELSVKGQDGAQMTTAVFYVDKKLYVLVGRTEPDASGLAVRFQQSLQFIDAQGRTPRRPEDGPGFGGGRGFGPPPGEDGGEPRRRRRPPERAFTDCRGKTEGAAVQHQTPAARLWRRPASRLLRASRPARTAGLPARRRRPGRPRGERASRFGAPSSRKRPSMTLRSAPFRLLPQ